MDFYVLILRILHIAGGVFWAGATWMIAGFLTPASQSTGKSGQEVMQHLIGKRRLSDWMGIGGTVTLLSGLLLYWRASGHLNPGWITSGQGLGLTIGALAGIAGFLVGSLVIRANTDKMKALGQRIEASQGPPDPALLEEVQATQGRLESAGVWTSVLLAIAVLGMASFQQLLF